MKKLIFTILIFIIVFFIYYLNISKNIYYVSIGDHISYGINNLEKMENNPKKKPSAAFYPLKHEVASLDYEA